MISSLTPTSRPGGTGYAIAPQKVDIGVWGSHADSIGVEILRGQKPAPHDAHEIIKEFNASPKHFLSIVDRDLLGAPARKLLMHLADSQHAPGQEDLKVDLTLDKLKDLIGKDIVDSLVALFAGQIDEVKIR